jgi:hypothetical protein
VQPDVQPGKVEVALIGPLLTPCMPYMDLRPHHGRYGCQPAVVIARGAPWLTVSNRWFAAPRRPQVITSVAELSAAQSAASRSAGFPSAAVTVPRRS